MNIKDYETQIRESIVSVIEEILTENPTVAISAKARAGAEISDWLEAEFVKKTKSHQFLKNSEQAPAGKTKNPWDARTFYTTPDKTEEIWIDFKALKTSASGSNPDVGTPNKVINFIKDGNFYLLFVHVYYDQDKKGIKFQEVDGNKVHSYFLKDISKTFRRNPKNQLQVGMDAKPEYRTREEFIKLLAQKIKESHQRQIEISTKALKGIDGLLAEMLVANTTSEKLIEIL